MIINENLLCGDCVFLKVPELEESLVKRISDNLPEGPLNPASLNNLCQHLGGALAGVKDSISVLQFFCKLITLALSNKSKAKSSYASLLQQITTNLSKLSTSTAKKQALAKVQPIHASVMDKQGFTGVESQARSFHEAMLSLIQVWSISQVYSFSFLPPRINWVFLQNIIKASTVLDGVLEPPCLSAAHLTIFFVLLKACTKPV